VEYLLEALPKSVQRIAVLDRTKEPGGAGEPLYQDVITALAESWEGPMPKVIGGRYGLSSKEFNPSMVKGVLDELTKEKPKNHFTIGINDDVTHTSLTYDPNFSIEPDDVVRAVFWGLGADGTVSANKNSIKIIGEETENYAQGYFVYDSKKSGARTVSHLRFGPRPIQSTYLIQKANFVAIHQAGFLERYDVLGMADQGAIVLLNSVFGPDKIWDQLPRPVQQTILDKKLKLWVIDAYNVANEVGLGGRINTIMQAAFFNISGVLPQAEAIAQIKDAVKKTYGKRGEAVIRMNYAAIDAAVAHLHQVNVPQQITSKVELIPPVPQNAPDFVREVTAAIIAGFGDDLPVSALPDDGTYPCATTQWEKRNIGLEVPLWDPDVCIQCGKCVLVCPHAVIRSKLVHESDLANAPEGFVVTENRWREVESEYKYTLQVAMEDCTGCTLCVEVCPAKNKSAVGRKAINMTEHAPIREKGLKDWDFFLELPEYPRHTNGNNDYGNITIEPLPEMDFKNVKNVQLLQPLFEFSGACAGCGETPYLKLLSQLFGDRTVIANATGCSSIYGGNLPTTPWAVNKEGRGPAWSNSLFEDNAEFGLGMRLTLDKQRAYALELTNKLRAIVGDDLANDIFFADQSTEQGIHEQRQRVIELKATLEGALAMTNGNSLDVPTMRMVKDLLSLADMLVEKVVWIVGGDGWAYDIGFGGLDHVMASGRNVNILVMDTEVYSNTGGQASKATPMAAVAKFAAGGKPTGKKDLAMMAINYGNVYVAQIAMGASDAQTMKAFIEAQSYDGPSIIIAYSHCIAHGINMAKGMEQQKLATDCGYWPLFRYDPRLKAEGKNPLQLDSRAPKMPLERYAYNENRYRMLTKTNPEAAEELMDAAQQFILERWSRYEQMAAQEGKSAERTKALES
jgi:pyruvate-ferredoxin/flavodoxin oxidoreductase